MTTGHDETNTLRAVAKRALLLFLLIVSLGGALIGAVIMSSGTGTVGEVVKTEFEPVPVRSPDRPARYPDELPTVDNITIVSVEAKPGVRIVHVASPDTPEVFVDAVVAAFKQDGWEMTFSEGATDLSGGASLENEIVGVFVTPSEMKGAPKGWTSAIFTIQNEEVEIEKTVTQPLEDRGPKA